MEKLMLRHPGFSGPGLSICMGDLLDIQMFPELTTLGLNVSQTSPDAIRSLSSFDDLSAILLSGDGKSIPLDWIDSLPNLEELWLVDVPLSELDSETITALSSLSELHLDTCHTTPGFWKVLSNYDTLQTLRICEMNLDDSDLEQLQQLPALKKLEIIETKVTKEGVRKFQKARSDVTVFEELGDALWPL